MPEVSAVNVYLTWAVPLMVGAPVAGVLKSDATAVAGRAKVIFLF